MPATTAKINHHKQHNLSREQIAALGRGGRGETEALPEIAAIFDERPDLPGTLGNLALKAQIALIEYVAKKDLTEQEAVRRHLPDLFAQLVEETDGGLERVLIHRVILGWIAVHGADRDLVNTLKCQPGDSPLCRAAMKRLESAQARYLAAARTLAMVRGLRTKKKPARRQTTEDELPLIEDAEEVRVAR